MTRVRILVIAAFAAVVIGAAYSATGLPWMMRTVSYVYARISGHARVGQGFVGIAAFGDWRLICVPRAASGVPSKIPAGEADAGAPPGGKTAATANACRINQEVPSDDAPKRVIIAANLSVVGPQKKPALMLRLPPTLHTGDPVALRLDGGAAVKTAVRDCSADECVAASAISDSDWNRLVAAQTLQIMFRVANGQNVFVDLPVNGLAEATAAMDAAQIAASL